MQFRYEMNVKYLVMRPAMLHTKSKKKQHRYVVKILARATRLTVDSHVGPLQCCLLVLFGNTSF